MPKQHKAEVQKHRQIDQPTHLQREEGLAEHVLRIGAQGGQRVQHHADPVFRPVPAHSPAEQQQFAHDGVALMHPGQEERAAQHAPCAQQYGILAGYLPAAADDLHRRHPKRCHAQTKSRPGEHSQRCLFLLQRVAQNGVQVGTIIGDFAVHSRLAQIGVHHEQRAFADQRHGQTGQEHDSRHGQKPEQGKALPAREIRDQEQGQQEHGL